MCLGLVFLEKVFAVLEAFCVVLVIVLRAVSFESDKVFAPASYETVGEDMLNFVLRFPIDDIQQWRQFGPFVQVIA